MVRMQANIATLDPVWSRIRAEAEQVARVEPLMASLVHAGILHHASLERALSYRIAQKLASPEMSELILREIADEAYQADPELGAAARADILAVFERDPACHRYLQPLLFFKGFQAFQCYRIGHWLWGRRQHGYGLFHPDADVGSFRRRYPSRGARGAGDHDRPRAFDRDRRDRRRGRQCVDAALGDPRRHRKRRWRSASEDRRRRSDRSGCCGPRQHSGRWLQSDRGGLRRAAGRATLQDRGRSSGAGRWRSRLRRAIQEHEPVDRRTGYGRIAFDHTFRSRQACREDAPGCA